jgi:hypothetical protein
MGVSLKTEKRRSQQTALVCQCPVFSIRQRVRRTNDVRWRAEGLPGMTTEDLHGHERRSAPPAWLPPICMIIPDHSSFSVLRETPMTFACGHFKMTPEVTLDSFARSGEEGLQSDALPGAP